MGWILLQSITLCIIHFVIFRRINKNFQKLNSRQKRRQLDALKVVLYFQANSNIKVSLSDFTFWIRIKRICGKRIVQTSLSLFTHSSKQDLVCSAPFQIIYGSFSEPFFFLCAFISQVWWKKINLPHLRSEHRFLRQHFHSFSHFTLSCTMPE